MGITKGKVITAVGVAVGTVLFAKFLKTPVQNVLNKVA